MSIQTGSIYVIKNRVNNKVYIGQTTMSVKERFYQHMKPSTLKSRGTYKIYNAINKYGKENFFVEIVETGIPIDRLDEKEISYIKQYDSCNNGYNTAPGGKVRRIYEPRDINNIISMFEQGYTAARIAQIYKVNKATILRTIHGSGYYVHDNLNKEELKKLVNDGLSNQEIADKLNTKPWTVERRLHDYGIRRKRVCFDQRKDIDYKKFVLDVLNGVQRKDMCAKYDISKSSFDREKKKIMQSIKCND